MANARSNMSGSATGAAADGVLALWGVPPSNEEDRGERKEEASEADDCEGDAWEDEVATAASGEGGGRWWCERDVAASGEHAKSESNAGSGVHGRAGEEGQ